MATAAVERAASVGSGRSGARRSARLMAAAARAGSAGSDRGTKVRTTSLNKLPKDIRDLCAKCCNPGMDGGLQKPAYLAEGAPYQAPVSSENFFTRGAGGTFRAGAVRKKAPYMPGAVHSTEPKEPKKRPAAPPGGRPGFKPSSGVGDLFSVEPGLGPSDMAMPKPARVGGFKVGNYKPKVVYKPDEYHAAREFRYVAEPDKGESKEAPPFKSGAPGSGFFDSSMLMSEPVGDVREPPAKRPLAGPWKTSGPKKGTLGRFPKHQPDPYGLKPPPGAETRHGQFGVCCVPGKGGRATKPIAWYKTRTGDVYRTRDLHAAAAAAGYTQPLNVGAITSAARSSGAAVVTFAQTV
mmetsp:Transcript_13591/g.32478  ORF Transcript_13591/g.32478 Transcript_13591/m.32478 type:complete len:351 (+) Transcript_13591:179-1231(+)